MISLYLSAFIYVIFIAGVLTLATLNMRRATGARKIIFGGLLVGVVLGHIIILSPLNRLVGSEDIGLINMIMAGMAVISLSLTVIGTQGLITNPRLGQCLGLLAFISSVALMSYFMFGPTVGVKGSGGRSYTTSYWSIDPGIIRISIVIWATAFMGAVFAVARFKFLVLIIGLLILGFSALAFFSIGPLTFVVALIFLASAITLPPRRAEPELGVMAAED